MHAVEQLLSGYLVPLEAVARRPSPQRQAAAVLAAQAHRIGGIVALHRNQLPVREARCRRALQFAEIACDASSHASALISLASTYFYAADPQAAASTGTAPAGRAPSGAPRAGRFRGCCPQWAARCRYPGTAGCPPRPRGTGRPGRGTPATGGQCRPAQGRSPRTRRRSHGRSRSCPCRRASSSRSAPNAAGSCRSSAEASRGRQGHLSRRSPGYPRGPTAAYANAQVSRRTIIMPAGATRLEPGRRRRALHHQGLRA